MVTTRDTSGTLCEEAMRAFDRLCALERTRDDAEAMLTPRQAHRRRLLEARASAAEWIVPPEIAATVHALIVSVQSRRRDLAVLRALGADRRWIGRTVHWQATVLAATPIVIGVPLGLIAGAVVFRAFVNRIGALPEPAVPILLVLILMVVLIAVANIAAFIPARRARLAPVVELLRAE